MHIEIRSEQVADQRRVEEITRDAFWDLNVPGCDEHLVAHRLRGAPEFIGELDLVAVVDGTVAGNIMYCRARVEDANGVNREVATFGPVSVAPALQGRGIGSALIRHSLRLAAGMGLGAVLIYGYPGYYERFGFANGKKYGIAAPDGRFMKALQALELFPAALDGVSGRFFVCGAYYVEPAEVESFDATFSPRGKTVTETQKRFAAMLNSCV